TITLSEPGEEPPLPERVGESGRYVIGRQLGKGGFGMVFEAVDVKYGGGGAVKFLYRENAAALSRFKEAFRRLVRLDPPHLVRLYELGTSGGWWFLVMERVLGTDICRHAGVDSHDMDISRIDIGRLRRSFADLARGLMALHEAGMLHRDIKPPNVLAT